MTHADWIDLASALLIALFASAIAALWPWLTTRQRRVRFQSLIRRELEETGPHPSTWDDRPWWQYMSKRFVHEEIFARDQISENRDFILSLDPSVTYHVSQLWISFEKRDLEQWKYHIYELSKNRHVESEKLRAAAEKWQEYSDTGGSSLRASEPMNLKVQSKNGLFNARRSAYGELCELTRETTDGEISTSPDALTDWYYEKGNGLLLSGDALRAFLDARACLGNDSESAESVVRAMSNLRTELKIDLGVRHPDEGPIELARPTERIAY